MKILVLMPCDEKMTYIAAKIYKELPNEIKDITFSMPMFMDYLISSKVVGNWVYAFFDAFVISALSVIINPHGYPPNELMSAQMIL